MELCALGSFGRTTEQSNPALELPLVRRVLGAALQFSAILSPEPDSAERTKVRKTPSWPRSWAIFSLL